jgi:hypothetical protein
MPSSPQDVPSGPPPPPANANFAGSWQGPTSLGNVVFSVSQGQIVTAITFEYRFERCAGSKTLTDLNVPIIPPPSEPSPNPLSNYPNFRYQSDVTSGESTQLFCAFLTGTKCTGYAVFTYPSCSVATHIAQLDAAKN